jgi:hypothetical protein
MQDGSAPLPISRPWRIIAGELSVEKNPNRISELADELIRALNGQLGNINVFLQDRPLPPRRASKP